MENRGAEADGIDDIRLTDRFFLGEPQIRGFDIRGVGPRVVRTFLVDDGEGNPVPVEQTNNNQNSGDAIGGKSYYLARAEIEIPLGSGARELGLRPSIFVDAGAVFNITQPQLQSSPFPGGIDIPFRDSDGNTLYALTDAAGMDVLDANNTIVTTIEMATNGTDNRLLVSQNIPAFTEQFFGDTASPRVSVGIGVNWNSPFGPFRIDIAKALLKEPGDDTKLFTFNVGTQF